MGPAGTTVVATATVVATDTVRRGRREIERPATSCEPGGGRKRAEAEAHDAELVAALAALIDPVTRNGPMSPLRWTAKSTRRHAGPRYRPDPPPRQPRYARVRLGYFNRGF